MRAVLLPSPGTPGEGLGVRAVLLPSPGTPGEGLGVRARGRSRQPQVPEYRERGVARPHPQPLSRSTGRGEKYALTPNPSPGVPGEGSRHALTPNPSPGVLGEGRNTPSPPTPPGVPGEGRDTPSPPAPLPEYRERGERQPSPDPSPGVAGEGSTISVLGNPPVPQEVPPWNTRSALVRSNYLNTKPLICDLEELAPEAELVLDVPSRLADLLAAGTARRRPDPRRSSISGAGAYSHRARHRHRLARSGAERDAV